MKKEAVPSQEHTVADVARDTRRRTAYLIKKPFVEQKEIYALSKEFFKAFLKKPQEFTCDELKRELHKVYLNSAIRDRVDALIDKLSLLEYTETQYSQAEIKLIVHELDSIVKDLFIEHTKRLPFITRIANWLFRKKPNQNETIISDYPMLEENEPVHIELNTILEDIYLSLEKNNIRKAAKSYKQLMRRYDNLGSSTQQEFYHKLHAAYKAIAKQTE